MLPWGACDSNAVPVPRMEMRNKKFSNVSKKFTVVHTGDRQRERGKKPAIDGPKTSRFIGTGAGNGGPGGVRLRVVTGVVTGRCYRPGSEYQAHAGRCYRPGKSTRNSFKNGPIMSSGVTGRCYRPVLTAR